MEAFAELRATAHARSAARHEGIAEFHRAVSQIFDSLGDDARARSARNIAELQRQQAIRERQYAAQPHADSQIPHVPGRM